MDTNKLLKEVLTELLLEIRTNSELNSRLSKIIEKNASSTRKQVIHTYRRKAGAFDPMSIFQENPEKLKVMLDDLSIEELKDIVAEQGMDRGKLAMKWRTKERFTNLIITTVESRIHKGDAFRTPPIDYDNDHLKT
jgi:hypothetical protein